jgi:nucleobase:cation symporter-1, NCS1 family
MPGWRETMTSSPSSRIPPGLETSPLINEDLAPVPQHERTWDTYHIAALWIGMSVCIPTYMLAAGLIAGGMSWVQAIFTIMLGNLIVTIPMVLNGHAGAKYGIPFPILVRSSFGVLGANIPAILRAIVACGWFGIQTWIGGQAIDTLMTAVWSGWSSIPAHVWISFAAFWLMNMYFVVRGTESIKFFEAWAAPFLIVAGLALLAWAVTKAGGFGPVMSQPSKFQTSGEFMKFFIPSLTAMVGFWATLALNIPDFTRFAKSQRAQVLGQFLGLPPTMTLFAFIGVVVTSATLVIFGETIWDPVVLLGRFTNPLIVFIAIFALSVATLTTNIAANVVSPANDFANAWPRKIDFKTGGIITGVIGILMMPWKLLSDYGTYIFGWLIGYSSFLGPIAGILIADYFVVRRMRLDVKDLYRRGGAYEFSGGFNWRAIGALAAGVFVALVGLFAPALRFLYDYAWFVGFAVAFVVYWTAMAASPRAALAPASASGIE